VWSRAFKPWATEPLGMPATLELACTDEACALDMVELHYTYDMPDDAGASDFACPYCGGTECLTAIEV